MLSTALQGLPFPDDTDPDDVPAHVGGLAQAVETQLVMRFSSSTARDAAITAPVEGMLARIGGRRLTYYDGTSWKDINGSSLPDPLGVTTNQAVTSITSGAAWTNLPNMNTISLTLVAPAIVTVEYGAWFQLAGTGDLRLFAAATGATTQAPPGLNYGEVPYFYSASATSIAGQSFASRTSKFNAGTTVLTVQVWKNGTPSTANVNYPTLRVTPLRWA